MSYLRQASALALLPLMLGLLHPLSSVSLAQTTPNSGNTEHPAYTIPPPARQLIQYPGWDPVVGVRCIPQSRQQRQQRYQRHETTSSQRSTSQSGTGSHTSRQMLQTQRTSSVTVEIEGDCRNVSIQVHDGSSVPIRLDPQAYERWHEDYDWGDRPSTNDHTWLTRPGSGWYWLLHRP